MPKKRYYPEVNQALELSKVEEEILKYWEANKIFEQSVKMREGQADYVFYDGPPFASGLPHYGHLLAGYVKDSFARYHTMLGQKVERLFGWDCHGLPAEMGVEKESGISGRKAIMDYGVDKFNDLCKTSVMKYVTEWKHYVNRMGRWVDFDNGYKTMNTSYMESVMWVFKQLYDKGLVYEDFRVMPYSWTCQTPVSNFETKQDNSYREKADKAVTVKFKVVANDVKKITEKNVNSLSILAWTTTPWTLPSNLALAVNKDIDYVLVKIAGDNYYVIGKDALPKYKKEIEGEVVAEFKGEKLLGLHYEPIFSYLQNLDEVKKCDKCYSVLHGDYVTTTDGTGIVHTAPGFGEDDNAVCKKVGIPTVCPVDDAGCFIEPINDYLGIQVFETNDPIIIRLKGEDKWLKTEQILHMYPHCWRTDAPLIYRALSSWYVSVEKFKDKLIKNNQEINWIPGHVKDGRFGKWLEGARDWSISRNRFFGCPIPIWRSTDNKYPRIDVYGSIAELEADFGVKVKDLHRPYIDDLTRKNPDDPTGKSMMVRVPDVMDCWFESGSMPYGQHHYPFENKDWFDKNFPADFITEGDGQLRGWFYVLLVLSTALFDKPCFKNCISYGIIVDETGKKLSKRLRNYVDPMEACDLYGSDSLRWVMMKSPALKGEEIRLDKNGRDIKDTLRMSIKPVLNSYNFFCMYANSDGIKAEEITKSSNVMDIYILSKMKIAIENIKKAMDEYTPALACKEVDEFFETLNNWYIRRNKNRFWKSEMDDDKTEAYNTLYTVLLNMCRATAPLLPFTTEFIWRGLKEIDNG
jgi:isoleucyl-tRNA synthetase